ncbi:MAG TPA: 50S ribosomal protein L5 [Verrucomicrobiae bacterium]|nr:50S ribosomal protein L5 [Verrucomicrobiae bacterium]
MHAYQKQYTTVAVPKLTEHTQYVSPYLVPKLEKVVINMGTGDILAAGKNMDEAAAFLSAISGQKAVITKSTKAIAGFKIRQGMPVGLKVTLRGKRMQDFMIKLTQVVLPRTRDFRGVKPSSIASNGSMHLGIKDSVVFPEVANGSFQHPLQVSMVVTPACSPEAARILFESLGFVFQTN